MGNIWQGEKVKLRPVEVGDIDSYFTLDENSDTDLQRMGGIIGFPITKGKIKEKLEKVINKEPENDEYMWIIEDNEGNIVGDINTYTCNRRNGTFKYGIGLRKQYWGMGYAAEAVKIILRYYFRELRYQKVTPYIYSFNRNSAKLHEKLGFKEEGRLRRMLYTNGEYHDEIYFGMTKEEFDQIDEKYDLGL